MALHRLFPGIAALVSIALVAPALPSALAGPGGCLAPGVQDRITPLGPFSFAPGYDLALAESDLRLPPIPTLLAVGNGETCDLTHGLGEFLDGRIVLKSDAEALQLAFLAASATYVDALPGLRLLPDETLDVDAPAPVVTRAGDGFVATFQTWTPRNGLVVEWTVPVRGVEAQPQFRVLEAAQGPYDVAIEGWILLPGHTEKIFDPPRAEFTKVKTGANSDGTIWRITYFTERYTSEAEADFYAQRHIDEGRIIYDIQVGEWGFTSRDPDRIFDVTLNGCACISAGFNTNIRMYPRALDLLSAIPSLKYPSDAAFTRIVLGHEFHHHLQYSINQWKLGNWMTEGGARFSETAFDPDTAHSPTTIQYLRNSNGFNGFMLSHTGGISSHSYDFGLFWGFLYAHNGGIAVLKAAYEESVNVGSSSETDGPKAIDKALARMTNPKHRTFEDAYRDFAVAMLRKDFKWGLNDGSKVKDWGLYLVDAKRGVNLAAGAVNKQGNLGLWGIEFANLSAGKNTALALQVGLPMNALLATKKADGSWKIQDAVPAAADLEFVDGAVVLMHQSSPVPHGTQLPALPEAPAKPPNLPGSGANSYAIRGILA